MIHSATILAQSWLKVEIALTAVGFAFGNLRGELFIIGTENLENRGSEILDRIIGTAFGQILFICLRFWPVRDLKIPRTVRITEQSVLQNALRSENGQNVGHPRWATFLGPMIFGPRCQDFWYRRYGIYFAVPGMQNRLFGQILFICLRFWVVRDLRISRSRLSRFFGPKIRDLRRSSRNAKPTVRTDIIHLICLRFWVVHDLRISRSRLSRFFGPKIWDLLRSFRNAKPTIRTDIIHLSEIICLRFWLVRGLKIPRTVRITEQSVLQNALRSENGQNVGHPRWATFLG